MKAMHNTNQYAIVLVDPIVSYRYISRFFELEPVMTIAVLTQLQNNATKQIEQMTYNFIFHTKGSVSADIDVINNLLQSNKKQLLFIINGCDDSLLYTEQLLTALSPVQSNNPISYIRTDKSALAEFLTEQQIEPAKHLQIKPDNYHHALTQYTETLTFPAIIKPAKYGSGSEGVSIVYNQEELQQIVQQAFGKKHSLSNKTFDTLMIQPFFQGTSYCVNVASCNGEHVVVSVWTGEMINNTVPYIKHLIHPNDSAYRLLTTHAVKVLDCLGVKYGIHHIELIIDGDQIHTIDFNPRISGGHGAMLDMTEYLYGYNELSLLYFWLNHRHFPSLNDSKMQASLFLLYYHPALNLSQLDIALSSLKSTTHIYYRNFDCNISEINNIHESVIRIISLISDSQKIINDDINFLMQLSPDGGKYNA